MGTMQNSQTKATYTYLADGTKAEVQDANNEGFVYLGTMVYNKNSNNHELESTNFGGGRINKTTAGYDINYFITDHLGSTRAIVNASGNIVAQSDYYPFGLQHENSNLIASTNRWGFSGKEKQTTAEINYLDFTNRMYDEFLGRWTTQDPLQEKYYPISQYAYCANSPIRYVDPDGKEIKLAGTAAQRQNILTHMQRLTNDKLGMRSDGTVIIAKMGGENSGKYLKTGSELIRDLNKKGNDAKTVTVSIGLTGSGNSTETVDRTTSGNVDWTNAKNGTGANATVNFDLTENVSRTSTIDPTTGNVSNQSSPYEVVLGHELIHADHINKGTVDFTPATHTYQTATGTQTQTVATEELKTVGVSGHNTNKATENKIRKEQGLNKRGAY
jgi:RHS repeat-associated protein